jgi:hypothetical protein
VAHKKILSYLWNGLSVAVAAAVTIVMAPRITHFGRQKLLTDRFDFASCIGFLTLYAAYPCVIMAIEKLELLIIMLQSFSSSFADETLTLKAIDHPGYKSHLDLLDFASCLAVNLWSS